MAPKIKLGDKVKIQIRKRTQSRCWKTIWNQFHFLVVPYANFPLRIQVLSQAYEQLHDN